MTSFELIYLILTAISTLISFIALIVHIKVLLKDKKHKK